MYKAMARSLVSQCTAVCMHAIFTVSLGNDVTCGLFVHDIFYRIDLAEFPWQPPHSDRTVMKNRTLMSSTFAHAHQRRWFLYRVNIVLSCQRQSAKKFTRTRTHTSASHAHSTTIARKHAQRTHRLRASAAGKDGDKRDYSAGQSRMRPRKSARDPYWIFDMNRISVTRFIGTQTTCVLIHTSLRDYF